MYHFHRCAASEIKAVEAAKQPYQACWQASSIDMPLQTLLVQQLLRHTCTSGNRRRGATFMARQQRMSLSNMRELLRTAYPVCVIKDLGYLLAFGRLRVAHHVVRADYLWYIHTVRSILVQRDSRLLA